mgnify:CR=1 FL=1
MRRADRLMQLVQLLRDNDLHRAEELAAATGVSLRTIYRDIRDLSLSGVPVEGSLVNVRIISVMSALLM